MVEQLGANPRLTSRDLQRLYANPNSVGFLALCLPVFVLSVVKAAAGGLFAGLATGAVALWLALRSLPSNLCRAASTAWRTKYLGLISRTVVLVLVLPLGVLVWPLALLVMGIAQGASEAGALLFNRTSDSLQPAGQHSFMFIESPLMAGVHMAVAELKVLVGNFAHLNKRGVREWLDKHEPPSPAASSPGSKCPSVCSSTQPSLIDAKVAATDLEGTPAQAPPAASKAHGGNELSIEERVARGVVALLAAVLGGLLGALGMLALGGCHLGKVSKFVWRQLARWAWVGPTPPPPSPTEQAPGSAPAATASRQQVKGEGGKGGAMGMLASTAALPQKTLTAQNGAAGGGARLSMSSVTSVDSQGLGSIVEEEGGSDLKTINKVAAGQQQQGPQHSGNSGSSSSGDAEAPQCTATVLAPSATPATAAFRPILLSGGTTATTTGPIATTSALPASPPAPAEDAHKCTCGACLRWAAVLPLFPFVPLVVLAFVLLTSFTWLLGGAMLSMTGAWRATTWSGVFAGGLEPVVEALESLHLSVIHACARAAPAPTSGAPVPPLPVRCTTRKQQPAAAVTKVPCSDPPRMPQPAQHLTININVPAPAAAEQQQLPPTAQGSTDVSHVALTVGSDRAAPATAAAVAPSS